MSLVWALIGVLGGVLLGVLGGFRLGERVRGRPRAYWLANGGAFLLCVLLDFVGLMLGQYWLALSAIGLLGGTITGLKYGYAESIGPWRILDSLTGGDSELRKKRD